MWNSLENGWLGFSTSTFRWASAMKRDLTAIREMAATLRDKHVKVAP
jgi:hypothetical protein